MEAVPDQFDALEVGILVHDPDTGAIRYANAAAEELYGYAEADLKAMEIGEFSSDSFSQAEAVQRVQAAADGQSQQFEWRNKRPTGELYWVEVRLSDLTIDGETYVVALVRDISEYKLNLRHLRVLSRITRHNLRNKLNVIDGFLGQLEPDERSDGTKPFDRIRRSVSELLALTGWIDTVRSATRVAPSAETRDIAALVTEVVEPYRVDHADIEWELDCEHADATADATLRTAIEELIDNAVTHNPHDELTITVSVGERSDDDQVYIRIADTGRPIPELEIEPIVGGYDPDPLEHGDGIGLWEVQTIINAHGGRISVVENGVERTVFEIALPKRCS
jgi:PAS domain S-box-containing protein